MVPGEYLLNGGEIEINPGRPTVTVKVRNGGDRPVQVGSHYHFFEANPALVFDRAKAYGMRLDLLSGNAVRFEPGDVKEVRLIPFIGERRVFGLNGLINGQLDDHTVQATAFEKLKEGKFGNEPVK